MKNIEFRCVQPEDYFKGLMKVLRQLTVAPDPSYDQFREFVDGLTPNHCVIVAEDVPHGTIVGTGTLFVERKLIHGLSKVGHIEDVVVNQEERGRGIGISVVNKLVSYAEQQGCYKVILDCKKSNAGFYEKAGFRINECQMVKYF